MTTVNVRDKIESIRQRHQSSIDRVRSDDTRTEDWKRTELAKIYVKVKRETDDMLEAEQRAVERGRKSLESKIFGTKDLSGDQGSLAISRRDADLRCAELDTEDAALSLLRRADSYGDETLARAVVQRAVARDWVNVGNEFLQQREHLAPALQELWNAGAEASRSDQFALHQQISSLRPSELRGMSQWDVERAAAPEDGGAAAPQFGLQGWGATSA